jgi:glycosyltransferase involved in cell wall biosynthesis
MPGTAPGEAPLVLHVLPLDLARGAQVVARTLRDRLDSADVRHRTVTLFRAPNGALQPDHELGLKPGLGRRVGFDARVVPALQRQVSQVKPAVVVAHGGEPLKYCAAARLSAPLVYYKVGSSRRAAHRPLRAAWHRRLMTTADHVVCISDEMAVEARDAFGVPGDRITTIPNGRDPALYRPASPGVSPATLIFVGHLEPPKRPDWFVQVVRRVAAGHPGTRGLVVGDGPLLDELRATTTDLPIDVVGRSDDVPGHLAQAQILVSASAREGMPGVLIEAGMAGLPAVTTDVAGARTVIDDGVTGLVTPVDDQGALAESVLELVADADRRAVMGAAARERCVARFSLGTVSDQWRELLATYLPAGSPAD